MLLTDVHDLSVCAFHRFSHKYWKLQFSASLERLSREVLLGRVYHSVYCHHTVNEEWTYKDKIFATSGVELKPHDVVGQSHCHYSTATPKTMFLALRQLLSISENVNGSCKTCLGTGRLKNSGVYCAIYIIKCILYKTCMKFKKNVSVTKRKGISLLITEKLSL